MFNSINVPVSFPLEFEARLLAPSKEFGGIIAQNSQDPKSPPVAPPALNVHGNTCVHMEFSGAPCGRRVSKSPEANGFLCAFHQGLLFPRKILGWGVKKEEGEGIKPKPEHKPLNAVQVGAHIVLVEDPSPNHG